MWLNCNVVYCTLVLKEEEVITLQRENKEQKELIKELQLQLETQKKDSFDVFSEMTRQTKNMQNSLMDTINQHENTIQSLRDQLGIVETIPFFVDISIRNDESGH